MGGRWIVPLTARLLGLRIPIVPIRHYNLATAAQFYQLDRIFKRPSDGTRI